ncbi:MAG: HEPN domain-containing protein [Bdellovibrionales bacterium]
MTRSKTRYTVPDTEGETITPSRLKQLGKDRQIEIMRQWFFENYEDPVNRTPYESAEGGYIYIYGGPFEAQEELGGEFGGLVKDEFIDELADELNDISWEWTHTERPSDYDDFYAVEATLDPDIPEDALQIRIEKIRELLEQKELIDSNLHTFLLMMIYSFSITTLECFLSDTFIRAIDASDVLKKKYVTEGKLKIPLAKLISMKDVKEAEEAVNLQIRATHLRTSYHDLETASRLYKKVLNVELSEISSTDKLRDYVRKRHDFVHRGGKDEQGNEVTTSKEEVKELLDEIEKFCLEIKGKLNPPFSDDFF